MQSTTIQKFHVEPIGRNLWAVNDGNETHTVNRPTHWGATDACTCGHSRQPAEPRCPHMAAAEIAVRYNLEAIEDAIALERYYGIELCDSFEPEVVPEPPARKRICNAPSHLKAFHAVAQKYGLDISGAAADRIRRAMAAHLGKNFKSRSELTANDWNRCTDGIEAGHLAW